MNRFIYHYMARSIQGNTETTYDGIAKLEHRIVDMDGYTELKELICEAESRRTWCIISLSFLGMEKEG